MLRTGDRALRTELRQSYAGGEARVFLVTLTFTVGGYGSIGGAAPGGCCRWAWK
jgi:hypothetical protein